MGPQRQLRTRGRSAALALALVVTTLLVGAPSAHALTSCGAGCIFANEDAYTFNYSSADTTTYSVTAANGLLANDNGPLGTKVDLQDTVDDWSTNKNLLTTDWGFTVKLNGDGSFTYTVDSTFSGDDTFTYFIWSADPGHSLIDFNTVTLTIKPVIHPVTYSGTGTIDIGSPGVLKNSSGVDSTTLTLDDTTANGGTITDNGDGAFTYTPPAVTGTVDSFTFDVYDINLDHDYPGTVFLNLITDTVKPFVAMSAPSVSVTLSPTFTVKWSATDGGGSGVSHYDVQSQTSGSTGTYGSWTDWIMGTHTTSASFTGAFGRSYCFRTRAVDVANNVSPWATKCTSVPLKAGSLSYSSGWQTLTNSAYFGGSAHRTTTKNATASRSSVYAKRVWLVVTKSASSGTVQVLWNGVVKASLNLASSTTLHQQKVAALSFSSVQKGTLTIKVTSSGKGVTLEGLDVFLS
jgi:hypothetical protein